MRILCPIVRLLEFRKARKSIVGQASSNSLIRKDAGDLRREFCKQLSAACLSSLLKPFIGEESYPQALKRGRVLNGLRHELLVPFPKSSYGMN